MREYSISVSSLRNLSICIIILILGSVLAAAQHETTLYSFGPNLSDGRQPEGALVADATGNLYGTTAKGGASNAGTVFELSPPAPGGPWTEAVLYAFGNGADGAYPYSTLVFDGAGNLYGTTLDGGNTNCGSCGTVFELSPPTAPGGNWTETTIHTFAGGNDGANPYGGLVFDHSGNLYGTTIGGGYNEPPCAGPPIGCGTVFELSPPATQGGAWTEAVLYSFTGGLDGDSPQAPVTIDSAGNLYGTTSTGGSNACDFDPCGTVFELMPSQGGVWTKTVIHNFNGEGNPYSAGLLWIQPGTLIGTTPTGGAYGGGVAFEMQPPSQSGGDWTYSVLYSFGQHEANGAEPLGTLILVDGMLFGTTIGGGSGGLFAAGTAFRLARHVPELAYKFQGPPDGASPAAGLLFHNGALYGTTTAGGNAGLGTIFRIAP